MSGLTIMLRRSKRKRIYSTSCPQSCDRCTYWLFSVTSKHFKNGKNARQRYRYRHLPLHLQRMRTPLRHLLHPLQPRLQHHLLLLRIPIQLCKQRGLLCLYPVSTSSKLSCQLSCRDALNCLAMRRTPRAGSPFRNKVERRIESLKVNKLLADVCHRSIEPDLSEWIQVAAAISNRFDRALFT